MSKTSLKTVAYNAIRDKIISCEYAPGTFLNEEILTAELNLSRTPVRDAIGRLEQEGLLEIRPKKGITVRPLSINDVNMIFEVRNLYEPYILLHYGQLLPKDKLREFYNIFSTQGRDSECFQNNDYFYQLDADFHAMIVNACPNIYLRQNYDRIHTQNERFRYMTGDVSNNRLEDTFKEHLDIIRPCMQNDWNLAAEKLIYHLEESKKASFQFIFNSLGKNGIEL